MTQDYHVSTDPAECTHRKRLRCGNKQRKNLGVINGNCEFLISTDICPKGYHAFRQQEQKP